MAIENTYLLGKNITLGCGFDLQAKAPLDSRQTVPAFEGLRALIIGDAAYEGMIVYDEGTKKTYQAQKCDSYTVEVEGKTKTYDIAFREFGINEAELKELIASETTAAMEFKGATATLPENPAKGDMWKVTASFEVAGETTKVGDSIVYNGEEWFRIPSGDDIEDTWRPVTGVNSDSSLTFAAGNILDVEVKADGTVTYSHEAIDAPELLAENEQTRTYITEVETDGYGHITGYKTATENVVDTNTEYTFEGQSDEATSVYFTVTSNEENASPETIYLDAYSKNEANAAFKAKRAEKLDAVATDANVFVDTVAQDVDGNITITTKAVDFSAVNNRIDAQQTNINGMLNETTGILAKAKGYTDEEIDKLEEYVGTIPNVPDEDGNNKYADLDVIGYINKKAQETLAAASGNSSETAASVKGQLDDYIGENNERVSGIESDITRIDGRIDGITNAESGILAQAKIYASQQDDALKAELIGKTGVGGDTFESRTIEGTRMYASYMANQAETKAKEYADGLNTQILQGIATADYVKKADAPGYADILTKTDAASTYAKITDLHSHDNKGILDAITSTDIQSWNNKVDKVAGKSLVADTEIERLSKVDNYNDSEVRGLIGDNAQAIEDLEGYVGTFTHSTAKTVVEYIDDKTKGIASEGQMNDLGNRVKAVEDEIDGLGTMAKETATDYVKQSLIGYNPPAEAGVTLTQYIGLQDGATLAEAKTYVDNKFKDADLAQYTTEQEVKDIVDGVIASVADSDTYNSLTKLVDYIDAHGGEAADMAEAIEALEGDVKGLKEAPSAGIKASDITDWNGEIGAKALAQSKLDASTFTNYVNLHVGDFTNEQIGTAISNSVNPVAADLKAHTDMSGDATIHHTHTNKAELNKIASGDVEKWNAAAVKADTALQEHQDISGKADKVSGAVTGNFAGLDANGNLTDSGKKADDFATAAQGAKADTAVQSIGVHNIATDYLGVSVDNSMGIAPGSSQTKPAIVVYATDKLKDAVSDAETALQSIGHGPNGYDKDELVISEKTANIQTIELSAKTRTSLAKADTALQTAGTGLKVVDKQVEFDEAVTFIFDCGGAEV